MQTISRLLLVVPVMGISNSVLAWGDQGHQIVALVAERHLTPGAQKSVANLLGAEGGHLEHVATWADCIKRSTGCALDDGDFDKKVHAETKPWHFVDIVITAPSFDPQKNCAKGDCVVEQIKIALATLSKANAPPIQRRLALKFLAHFVGDIHQPLHTAFKNLPGGKSDVGGNLRFVEGPKKTNDLHAFWDSDLVEAELAESANNLVAYAMTIDQGTGPQSGAIDPVAWANESHGLAGSCYKYDGVDGPHGVTAQDPVHLPAEYVSGSRKTVSQQLRLAGLRLAALLNQALDPTGAAGPVATRDLNPADFRN